MSSEVRIVREIAEDLNVILDELYLAFAEAEFKGKSAMTLTSRRGSKFHARVKRCCDALSKIDLEETT